MCESNTTVYFFWWFEIVLFFLFHQGYLSLPYVLSSVTCPIFLWRTSMNELTKFCQYIMVLLLVSTRGYVIQLDSHLYFLVVYWCLNISVQTIISSLSEFDVRSWGSKFLLAYLLMTSCLDMYYTCWMPTLFNAWVLPIHHGAFTKSLREPYVIYLMQKTNDRIVIVFFLFLF